MITRALSLLLLTIPATVAVIAVIACDPTESVFTPEAPKSTADAKAPATLEPVAPVPVDPLPRAIVADPVPDPRAAYSACLRACDGTKLAHADKAACRFNCEQPTAPADTPADPAIVGSDPVQYVVDCIDRCYSGGTRSDVCVTGCKSAVATLPAAPAASVLAPRTDTENVT